MKITSMPFFSRPGFRLKRGDSLSDAELLSILFDRGNNKDNAIDLANKLLNKHNLHKLKELGFNELKSVLKDEIKVLKIKSLCSLFERFAKLERKGFKRIINSPSDVYDMFIDEMKDLKKEHLYSILLDSKNKVIKVDLVSVGTLNSTLIHPREVFKEAIKESAASIILVHNHPSGSCEPSEEDIKVNNILVKTGNILNVKVLDNIIIGEKDWKSIR